MEDSIFSNSLIMAGLDHPTETMGVVTDVHFTLVLFGAAASVVGD